MDTITKQRLVDAVIALVEGAAYPDDLTQTVAQQVITRGIEENEPSILVLADRVQKIVAAYYGATDLNMEVTARAMLEMVANGNKAKRFVLPIIEGPGLGHWEMIIRRVRDEKPSLVIPTLAEKERLW